MADASSARRIALWILLVLLLAAPFIPSIMPRSGSRAARPEPSELMAMAAMYANESLHELSRALSLDKPSSLEALEVEALEARNVSQTLLEEAAGMPTTGFPGYIRRSMTSYAWLANASASSMLAAPGLYKGLSKTQLALNALSACRPGEYLARYSEARQELLESRQRLAAAMSQLLRVNTSQLLSPLHEQVAENLSKAVSTALEVVDELENLYSLVKTHQATIQDLCNGENPGQQRLGALSKALAGLQPDRAGPLGYSEAEAILHIESLIKAHASPQGHGGASGGQGAGYRAPSSDD